eukprot:Gregarina_sp_Pseudo_9__202@NODE_1131_length_1853_cov_590_642227_g1058_i0_p1_GENE_NODE_1131_length_1853_cov_590_642227_g1058_i0NODE_1131_length_1853_cov_590_642227_g1058_i0_p1_ORF_typecomplete_len472_score113_99UNC93/PF05978_16/7_3e29UNC93/PF05978_16/5e02UNC93/PF05978_16/2_4e03MFS_1/PF07690_16/1_4e18MFS_1/PF07690_16/1_8e02Sugar_tr/PF00083_24/0_00052DUF3169/PF11368_8/4_8e03DUF3169/PF11368_8/4_3e02DUF3169/PF11368_8/0_0022DUF3169/PF11368_8/3_3e02OATP/PF03137_20/0_81_NODE_1131_length_1853_cov_590_642
MKFTDAITQILILGCIAFCCPGLFNALTGLGKAGGKNADIGNKANATLYAFFAVFGYFGGTLFNLFGNRVLILFGGLCYALYSAGMYIAGNVDGAGWVSILVGAILGIGAGMFWTAQGAMMMAYATPHNKGAYIGWFWIIFNLGGLAGGLLSFGINFNNSTESANPASYFTFVGLMGAGAIAGLFLLVSPKRVKKEDGTMVEFEKAGSAWLEIKGALLMIVNPYAQLLVLYFLASNWYYVYQFNYVNGTLFNVRTRGFNSCLYWGAEMASAYVMGKLLDRESMGRRAKAQWGFWYVSFWACVAWVLGIVLQYTWEGGYDKSDFIEGSIPDPVDITDSSRAAFPIICYVVFGWADACLQAFVYWIMGAVCGNDTALMARFAGFYKGIQSLGACISWAIDLPGPALKYAAQMWICIGLLLAGSPLAYFCVLRVKDLEEEAPAKMDEETVAAPELIKRRGDSSDASTPVAVAEV